MKRSKVQYRRVVLEKMFDLLDRSYDIDMSREQFVGGALSHHELDAILSFKSDAQLEELHGALGRINDGTYGRCISCKRKIDERILAADPACRMCASCEHELNRTPMHAGLSWLHQ
jgi:RNA polymerase-binding transcription factor DksA